MFFRKTIQRIEERFVNIKITINNLRDDLSEERKTILRLKTRNSELEKKEKNAAEFLKYVLDYNVENPHAQDALYNIRQHAKELYYKNYINTKLDNKGDGDGRSLCLSSDEITSIGR